MTHPHAKALELLEQRHWLLRLCRELVADPHTAEDLSQETLLAAFRQAAPRRAGLRTYMERIARNLAATGRRGAARRQRREAAAARAEAGGDPADTLQEFQLHRAVVDAVAALPEPLQTTFVLRYWEDLPPREIAARMAVPTETVRTRLKRGLQRLRGQLDQEYGERRAWLLPLCGLAGRTEQAVAVGALSGTTALVLAMLKSKPLVLSAALVALSLSLISAWPRLATPEDPTPPPGPKQVAAGPAPRVSASTPGRGESTPSARERLTSTADAALAGLLLDAGGQALADAHLCLCRPEDVDRFNQLRDRKFDQQVTEAARIRGLIGAVAKQDHERRMGNQARLPEGGMFHELIPAGLQLRSDAEGRFAITPQHLESKGMLCVWSEDEGCDLFEVTPGAGRLIVQMRPRHRLRGQVVDTYGKGLVGAQLSLHHLEPYHGFLHIYAGAEGRFETPPLPPGTGGIYPSLRGYKNRHPGSFTCPDPQPLDIEMEALPRLDLLLVDAQGRPWTKDRLEALGWKHPWQAFLSRGEHLRHEGVVFEPYPRSHVWFDAKTSKLGGSIADPEARYLSIWQGFTRLTTAALPEPGARRVRVDISALPEPAPCEIQLRWPEDTPQPWPEAKVTALRFRGRTRLSTESLWQAQSSGRLQGSLPGYLRGTSCVLRVTAEGFLTRELRVAVPERGPADEQVVHMARATHRITGQVVDSSNQPVGYADLILLPPGEERAAQPLFRRLKTDAAGRIDIDDVGPGSYLLLIRHTDLAPTSLRVRVEEQRPVRVVLAPGSKKNLRVGGSGRLGLCYRVFDAHDQLLVDTRLQGIVSYGGHKVLRLSPRAHRVEAWKPGGSSPILVGQIDAAAEVPMRAPQ